MVPVVLFFSYSCLCFHFIYTLLPIYFISPPPFSPNFLTSPSSLPEMETTKEDQGKRIIEVELEDDGDEDEDACGGGDDSKKKGALTPSKRRVSGSGGGGSSSVVQQRSCQVEDCTADMADAKPYHRRHKVCEFHAKASVVLLSGQHQRFCQQCSRFHEISEFDEAKRSCRRRLAGHNERRRKNSYDSH